MNSDGNIQLLGIDTNESQPLKSSKNLNSEQEALVFLGMNSGSVQQSQVLQLPS